MKNENAVAQVNQSPFLADKNIGLKLRLFLLGVRTSFKLLNAVSPTIAAHAALNLFLTPPKNKRRDWEKNFLHGCKNTDISLGDKHIRLRTWGSGPVVVLVHAWGGRGTQMGAFIKPLVSAGYQVVAVDGPAHGDSTGKRTDMFQFAAAINAAAGASGPVHAIVAHSFGAGCTLLAMREYGLLPTKLVLISCFASGIWVTENFAQKLSISRDVVHAMRKALERRYQNKWSWEELEITDMVKSVTIPILLVHDTEDKETPYSHALAIEKNGPTCQLFTTHGLGHRRILRDHGCIAKSVEFCAHAE